MDGTLATSVEYLDAASGCIMGSKSKIPCPRVQGLWSDRKTLSGKGSLCRGAICDTVIICVSVGALHDSCNDCMRAAYNINIDYLGWSAHRLSFTRALVGTRRQCPSSSSRFLHLLQCLGKKFISSPRHHDSMPGELSKVLFYIFFSLGCHVGMWVATSADRVYAI